MKQGSLVESSDLGRRNALRLVCAALAAALAGLTALATELNVPGNYASVEAALAAAQSGDVVRLAAGSNTLSTAAGITVPSGVSLIGAGPDLTIVAASNSTATTCRLLTVVGGRVEGITFAGAYALKDLTTNCTLFAAGGAVVTNCVFTGTTVSGYGQPVLVTGTDTLVAGTIFRNTANSNSGEYIYPVLAVSGATLSGCVISPVASSRTTATGREPPASSS